MIIYQIPIDNRPLKNCRDVNVLSGKLMVRFRNEDAVFFQGMLEGIAEIEKTGYRRLAELGAPWPKRVITTGGGAANSAWRTIREQRLGIPVVAAEYQEAAYGAALLAHGSGPHQ